MSPGVSGYQAVADFCPDLTLTGGRGMGLGRPPAATPFHYSSANCGKWGFYGSPGPRCEPWQCRDGGERKASRESLQGAPVTARLVDLDPATIW